MTVVKRADARRNIAAILDAATTCLAHDPQASLQQIAEEAGVGRVTLYAHFDSRAGLVSQVVARAMAATEEELAAIDLSGDPADALGRLLEATWLLTGRYGALVVAAEDALPAADLREAHEQPARRVRSLLLRGRRAGVFRTDMPVGWQVTVVQSVLHAAAGAVTRGELPASRAPGMVRETVLAALRS